MTLRTICFDWINTLVHTEPDRHVLSAEVCREFGIEVSDLDILRGIYAAEEEMPGGRPLRWSADEDPEVYLDYNDRVLAEAGIAPPERNTALAMLQRFAQRFKSIKLAVYDDTAPVLTELKERGIVTGVISNMPQPMGPMLAKLGVADLLDFAVTPLDVNGQGKPAAPIFLEALRRAGSDPGETMHVGDEHFVDGKGARAVGITPVIIDRHDLFGSLQAYHRITSLRELPALIDSLT
jgi:HAD superfamily hydrolase (TIGR01549 family)